MTSNLSFRLCEIVAETIKGCPLSPEKMTDEMSLVAQLGADSLEAIMIGIAAEEEFGIDLSDDDLDRIQTVGDLVAAVEFCCARKGARA